MNGKDKRLIPRLREWFYLSEDEFTDEEVLKISKGTLSRSLVELGVAIEDFISDICESSPRFFRRRTKKQPPCPDGCPKCGSTTWDVIPYSQVIQCAECGHKWS